MYSPSIWDIDALGAKSCIMQSRILKGFVCESGMFLVLKTVFSFYKPFAIQARVLYKPKDVCVASICYPRTELETERRNLKVISNKKKSRDLEVREVNLLRCYT